MPAPSIVSPGTTVPGCDGLITPDLTWLFPDGFWPLSGVGTPKRDPKPPKVLPSRRQVRILTLIKRIFTPFPKFPFPLTSTSPTTFPASLYIERMMVLQWSINCEDPTFKHFSEKTKWYAMETWKHLQLSLFEDQSRAYTWLNQSLFVATPTIGWVEWIQGQHVANP